MNLLARCRHHLCRWFGHRWRYVTIGDSPYWERTCQRCGRDETNEPLSIRNRRLHAEESRVLQESLGTDFAGVLSMFDAAIEDVRRGK